MKKLILSFCLMLMSGMVFGQWFQQNSGTTSNLNSIYCASKDTVFVCGVNGTILRTTNGGITWDSLNSSTTNVLNSIFFVNNEIGFVSGKNKILKTTDHGENWISVYSEAPPPNHDYRSIFFVNADTGCTVGDVPLLVTNDSGLNWIPYSPPPGFSYTYLNSVFFPTDKIGYTVGFIHGFISDNGVLGKTIDCGNNWALLNDTNSLFKNAYLQTVFFTDSLNGWTGGAGCSNYRALYRTIDGGINWDTLTTPFYNCINSVFFPNNQKGFIADAAGQIYNTKDSGTSWQLQVQIPNKSIKSIYCVDSSICYAVGDSGLILKTINGGEFIEENQLAESAINIYPNPTNDNLTIETTEKATIQILNIEGQIIKTINTADKQTSIDVTDLSSGVYIIKAKTESGVAVKKFIKE